MTEEWVNKPTLFLICIGHTKTNNSRYITTINI